MCVCTCIEWLLLLYVDIQTTHNSIDSDWTSARIHLTGLPVGNNFYICTTQVRNEIHTCSSILHGIAVFLKITHRSLWNMRNYIHVMLCANLFAAQLVFVVGVERTENEVSKANHCVYELHVLACFYLCLLHRLSVQPLLCYCTTCSWLCSCGC